MTRLSLNRAVVCLAALFVLAGCAEVGVPAGGSGSSPSPALPSGSGSDALARHLESLRRGLANQEQRIEAARRELQTLSGNIEKMQRAQAESLKNIERFFEEFKKRVEANEKTVALLRSGGLQGTGVGAGTVPPEGPSGLPPAGAPATGTPEQPSATTTPAPPKGGTPPAGPNVATVPPAGDPSALPSSPPVEKAGPEVDFNEAVRVLEKEKSFPRARLLLQRFIEKYPTHELADDAQYLIGESYFAEKNYERAILSYNKVQVDYANGDKAPDALLKEALSFLSLGDKASARELLERVGRKYPGSDAARNALERLKSF
ncbi:MAG: tol-pal system protein YbgF [bacterium]|nr:tol-pal system protein YbgF [bacterium]